MARKKANLDREIEEKLDYIGLELNKIPKKLKESEELNLKMSIEHAILDKKEEEFTVYIKCNEFICLFL